MVSLSRRPTIELTINHMNDFFSHYPILSHAVVGVGIIFICAIIGRLLKSALNSSLMRIFERTKTTLDDRVISIVRDYVLPLSMLAGIYFGIQYVRSALTDANQ